MSRTPIYLLFGLALGLMVGPAMAQNAADRTVPPPPDFDVDAQVWDNPDSPGDAAPLVPLADIEAYLQALTDFQAQFILIGPDYRTSHGTLSLSKPGRLRFEYDPPDQLLIVSDGKTISLVDYELKQVTRWPIRKTPLRPLVRTGEVFGEDVTVQSIRQYRKQIRVTIAEAGDEDEGSMELIFTPQPLQLEGWEVIDGRGRRTIIALNDMQTDISLEDALWTFDDPRPQRRRLPGKR